MLYEVLEMYWLQTQVNIFKLFNLEDVHGSLSDFYQTDKEENNRLCFFNDGELEMVSFSYSSRFLAMFCGLLSLLRMRNVQLNLGLVSLQWGRYVVWMYCWWLSGRWHLTQLQDSCQSLSCYYLWWWVAAYRWSKQNHLVGPQWNEKWFISATDYHPNA